LSYRQGDSCARPESWGRVTDDSVDVSAGVTIGRDDEEDAGDDTGGGAVTAPPFVYTDANDCSSDNPIASEVACRDDITITLDGTNIPWQEITMADIASFRPAPPTISGEPDGWAIAGLPANFVADAPQEVVVGELLGQPAEVRFTPLSFGWSYGDGATRSTASAGETWTSSGAEAFSPTPTSHVYEDRGTVEALLTVTYRAEYRFLGPDWIPVLGTLDIASPGAQIRVVIASTMLVDRA
jgi:hypothetical protein